MSKERRTTNQPLTRRDFLKSVGTVAAAGIVPSVAGNRPISAGVSPSPLLRPAASSSGFNILMILVDQERFNLNFPSQVELPNHERLKAQGLTFSNYYITTGMCTPSRSVIYTGQHVPHTRMADNTDYPYIRDLSPDVPTIGHMLRELGYYTAYKGKWHLSHMPDGKIDTDGKCYRVDEKSQEWLLDSNGRRIEIDTSDAMERYGFADFNPCGRTFAEEHGGYRYDPETAADAADWLQNRAPTIAQTQPWFIAVNFVNPHDVMYFDSDGPDGQTQATDFGAILPAPDEPLYAPDWQPDLPRSFAEDDLSTKPAAQRNMAEILNFGFGEVPIDRPDLWQTRANYYINCVRDVDQHIGMLLDTLEASGQADQTIIIFKSDHGEMGGAHQLGHKGPLIYEENNNVPFVIVHPDYPQSAGQTTATLASAVDFAPTVLALAGLTETERQEKFPSLVGYDLTGVLSQPDRPGARSQSAEGVLMTWDGLSIFDPGVYRKIVEIRTKRAAGERIKLFDYVPLIDLSKRGFMRGIFDGRYKFARYFSPVDYHLPEDLETLLALNELELYDTEADPDELDNLAHPDNPAYDPQLIETMNRKLNNLIVAEIGPDEGKNLPIPRLELYS